MGQCRQSCSTKKTKIHRREFEAILKANTSVDPVEVILVDTNDDLRLALIFFFLYGDGVYMFLICSFHCCVATSSCSYQCNETSLRNHAAAKPTTAFRPGRWLNGTWPCPVFSRWPSLRIAPAFLRSLSTAIASKRMSFTFRELLLRRQLTLGAAPDLAPIQVSIFLSITYSIITHMNLSLISVFLSGLSFSLGTGCRSIQNKTVSIPGPNGEFSIQFRFY